MPTFEANPLAQEKFEERQSVTAPLKTEGWSKVPLELRERALFSATVENLRFLDRVGKRLQTFLDKQRRAEGAYQTRERFIAEMQELAEEEGLFPSPDKAGTIEDLTSERRLRLIFDQNVQAAQNFARWKAEQDPEVLDAFPAQELVRIEKRNEPRNWEAKWKEAGGTFFAGGRMIALKNDPIWSKLSRFGTPWPPFDFGSGMGLEDIDRDEAEAIGLIDEDTVPETQETDFNSTLEAGVKDLSPRMRLALKDIFGDQIELNEESVKWRPRR